MIIDFTFSGLGPFKEPVTLTFEASNDEHLSASYVREIELDNDKKIRLLRIAMLYGANAAGKSTVLEALSLLDRLVSSPATDSEAEIDANFFAFNTAATEPSAKLTVKFVRAGKVYRYHLHLAKNSVLRETLEYQATPPDGTKFVLIYQRSRGDTPSQFVFTYGPKQKLNRAEQEKLEAELLPNATMLSVLNRKMTIQNTLIQETYLWFKEQLMGEVTPETNLTQWVTHQLTSQKINQNKLIQSLNQAGIPIANLNVVDRQLHKVEIEILRDAPTDEIRNQILDSFNKRKEVHTIYKIDGNEYQLKLNSQESLGTRRYYGLAGLLSTLCPESTEVSHCKILPIDEIEHSLHPDLLEHFLVTFLNDTSNSQLIATTHYRELLQNNLLFRDDVIWFVDKDEASLSSELYCLHDVKTNAGLRATSSVYNFYKHGRLGAVPKLKA
jgi:AAA15 family ATPase/GTPase